MRITGKSQRYRVVAHGLGYFCQKLVQLLDDRRWQVLDRSGHKPRQLVDLLYDLGRCDLAYTWGGRISMGKFLWAARALRKKKIVMLWSGSDVLFAQQELARGLKDSWVAGIVHWAVSPWVAEEVRAMGLSCEHVQASFVNIVDDPQPLPKEFSVMVYVSDVLKTDLYGWDRMLEVAERLPHVEFNLCGLPEGQTLATPPNIKIRHWVPDLTPILEQTSVVYRPVRHDGLSFTVLEALSQGRHVLYSYPLPGCLQVTSAEMATRELEKLYERHENGTLPLNAAGRNYIAEEYAPEKVRAELLRRWEQIILS